jgi:hypothetical protein
MFTSLPDSRKNEYRQWTRGDNLKAWKKHQVDGQLNYLPDQFGYQFNDYGFRCDNFSEQSALPILFLGCSLTEGIGLPVDLVWPTRLLNKIRSMPDNVDKKIPFWTLAQGGSGVDQMAYSLFNHIDLVKPKYIFYYLSNIQRRNFAYGSNELVSWVPSVSIPTAGYDLVGKVFVDEHYAIYQAFRSLALINELCNRYASKCFVFDWYNLDIVTEAERTELIAKFPNLIHIKRDGNFYDRSLVKSEDSLILDMPTMARDSIHPGAVWQYNLCNAAWDAVKQHIK